MTQAQQEQMQQQQPQVTAGSLAPSAAQARHRPKRRPLIGAIDQGTSSTRFLAFESKTGKLMASSQIEIQRIVPKEGWVEMDPNAIMASVYATIGEVYEQLAATGQAGRLTCIGICNQRESTVVWDALTGKPLYNVIVWMDNRTKDLVDELIDSVPGRDFNWLKDKTGLPMSTYFSAFKLRWLIDNVSDVSSALREKRLMFGTVDSWILWNLTGSHATDVTNASRTFLMDIESLNWDKSLCKCFKIPMEILPKILSSADDFGHIQHGPLSGLPITGVIGDQSAALFGHNCLQLGQTKATFGTGCFIIQNIGAGPLNGALSGVQREAKRGLVTTVGYKLRDRPACYALEGSIKIAGAALTWLRDNMQLIKNYDECDQLVNRTTHAAGVFFVPALGGLYSPYWDPNASGVFIGLSQFTRREHLVRATFDSIAYQTNDILSLMRGVTSGLMIDGGLCKSDNMCQILADITGCDIVRPSMCETSALGAAMVAGIGAGIWSYDSMLAKSNTPYEYQCSADQNHHYPLASLHYEDKFSSLIQSKCAAGRLDGRRRELASDAEDASYLEPADNQEERARSPAGLEQLHRPTPTSTYEAEDERADDDDDDTEGDAASSGQMAGSEADLEQEAAASSSGEFAADALESADQISSLESAPLTAVPSHRMRFYATPSSGYNSGDNFEPTAASSSGTSTARESPVSSPSLAPLAPHQHQPGAAGRPEPPVVVSVEPPAGELAEAGNRCACHRSALISRNFPSNMSTCLRHFICPPETAAAVADRMHDDASQTGMGQPAHELDDYDQESLSIVDSTSQNDDSRPNSQLGAGREASKPADVFQSYISLEHRTELVHTWHRAVERSMQWTKIHHEEIRRIDYQRLSSLPISIYLFVSIGMVALSGLLSATTTGGPLSL